MGPYDAWLDRPIETHARLDPWPAQAMAAMLGDAGGPAPTLAGVGGADLPCLWQWLYFLETPDRAVIAPDGHPAKGGFLPPVPLSRRMFAGGRTAVHRPLRLGADASMTQRVIAIQEKRPGPQGMWLLTVAYDYRQDGVLCVAEERDLAYLPPATSGPVAGAAAGMGAGPAEKAAMGPAQAWSASVTPDPVMLMKMSALTFNGHRIHYDREYAVEVEHYPERVVHGPLTAILLAELARREAGRAVTGFSFRARGPLFVNQPVGLSGTPDAGGAELTARDCEGRIAMTARADFG